VSGDEERFESIHNALRNNPGSIVRALAELNSMGTGVVWTFRGLCDVLGSPEYRSWVDSVRVILMAQAEHDALRKVAFSDNLSDQAQASIAVALLSGKTDDAKKKAGRAKEDRGHGPAKVQTQTEALLEELEEARAEAEE
jgi:hypothetical protein